MTAADFEQAVAAYLQQVRRVRAEPDLLAEPSLYAALGELLTAGLQSFGRERAAVMAQARTEYGVPDFIISQGGIPVGYTEAKRPGLDLGRLRGHDKMQFEQFLNLDNVLYTNYSAFRLYQDEELVAAADLGGLETLEKHGPLPSRHRVAELSDLLERFLSRSPAVPTNADELARMLARATRVLRNATEGLLAMEPRGHLARQKNRWQDVLFDEVTDREFADAYAQTVVYGLLTARLDQPEEPLTVDSAGEILRHHHAFLSAAFRTLTYPEIRDPMDWAVDVILTVLDPVSLETFRRSRHADDPLLYFYEEFLAAYDERLRKQRGVYYTPPSVVDFQVGAVADLVERLGQPQLLADEVVALDPAAGTGTYLLGLLDETLRRVKLHRGGGAEQAAMAQAARRCIGFEILVGPYTVAHQRVSARLRDIGSTDAPVRVYLADTLAEPHDVPTGQLSLLEEQLAEERAEVDQVKVRQPVMVVLGNPPYERARGRSSEDWLQQLMRTFTDPVRPEARVNLKNLADPYVHFFRWALWKLFESASPSGSRILSFISNRTYLLDYAFEGVRQTLRQRFDDIWIIDLEGESRGAVATENVFDIRVGVCIIVAVRRQVSAAKTEEATVRYTRFRGTREDKERQLKQELRDLDWSVVARAGGEPFVPEPTGAWRRWTPLDVLMPFRQSGVQTKRDALVVAPTKAVLEERLRAFLGPSVPWEERRRLFHETDARTTPPGVAYRAEKVRRYGYRPFSRCWLYDDPAFIDRPRPRLHQIWFPGQRALVTRGKGHGEGPAVVLHGELPDLSSFQGSHSGHVFPLWLDADRSLANLASGVPDALADLYGQPVTADDVIGHVLAVLSAPSYTRLFREGLSQGFPRVPFPLEVESFSASVGLGSGLMPILAMEPGTGASVRLHGRPGPLHSGRHVEDRLYVSEAAWVAPVSPAAWAYQVSGYRVLPRWLEYRRDLDLATDLELVDEVLATVGAVQRVVDMTSDLEANLRAILGGETVGGATVVPLHLADVARQLANEANEQVAAEAHLWDELSDEALLRGDRSG